jgi:hypothetical protein
MEVCPFCGITRDEREFQQRLVSEEQGKRLARWKQRNDPNEPAPGLPVTHEHRVHYALLLCENYLKDLSPQELPFLAIKRAAQEAKVDYNSVARALSYADRT